MENFEYKRHTDLIFGKNQFDKLGVKIKEYSAKKVLVTYGGGSIKASGLYDIVISELNKHNIEFIELSGIKPNPTVETARKGVQLIKDNDVDFILAVGGGSVLDNSKHMAIASKSDLDVWELLLNPDTVNELTDLPKIGSIITLAATGSEMNNGGVLSNLEINEKRAMFHVETTPVFTFEDPSQLFTLPEFQRRAGVCDMMSHLFEQYFGSHEDDDFADRVSEGLLNNILGNYEKYINSNDYNAHANIFLSATYSLNGLTSLGRASTDWMTHSMEHEVSAYTDLTHGIGLAIIHPKVLTYYYESDIKNNAPLTKFVNIGKNCFKLTGDDKEIAKACIEKIQDLFFEVSKVKYLDDVEIFNFDFEQSAQKLIEQGCEGSYIPLSKEDFVTIYKRTAK